METFHVTGEPLIKGFCGDCRFMAKELMQGQLQRISVCHWGPPTVMAMQTPRGIQAITQFPVVQANMYCHRYEKVSEALKPEVSPLAANVDIVPDGT